MTDKLRAVATYLAGYQRGLNHAQIIALESGDVRIAAELYRRWKDACELTDAIEWARRQLVARERRSA